MHYFKTADKPYLDNAAWSFSKFVSSKKLHCDKAFEKTRNQLVGECSLSFDCKKIQADLDDIESRMALFL